MEPLRTISTDVGIILQEFCEIKGFCRGRYDIAWSSHEGGTSNDKVYPSRCGGREVRKGEGFGEKVSETWRKEGKTKGWGRKEDGQGRGEMNTEGRRERGMGRDVYMRRAQGYFSWVTPRVGTILSEHSVTLKEE